MFYTENRLEIVVFSPNVFLWWSPYLHRHIIHTYVIPNLHDIIIFTPKLGRYFDIVLYSREYTRLQNKEVSFVFQNIFPVIQRYIIVLSYNIIFGKTYIITREQTTKRYAPRTHISFTLRRNFR